MADVKDLQVLDFDSGLVTVGSDNKTPDNGLVKAINVDFDETGKIKRRKGTQRYGTISTGLNNSFAFTRITLGSAPTTFHLTLTRASNGVLGRIVGTTLDAAASVGDTTINLDDGTLFANSGNVEIDGDIIAYTGKSTNQLTTVSGITFNHTVNSPVHQAVVQENSGVDTRTGAYFAVLNNLVFLNGRAGSATFDGSSVTAISDADEPAGLFVQVFVE